MSLEQLTISQPRANTSSLNETAGSSCVRDVTLVNDLEGPEIRDLLKTWRSWRRGLICSAILMKQPWGAASLYCFIELFVSFVNKFLPSRKANSRRCRCSARLTEALP